MSGGDFQGFFNVISMVVAGIIALGGAITVIEHIAERVNIRRNRVAEQVAEHEGTLEKHMQYLANDDKRIKSMEESNKLIMRGVMDLMTHEIDGNHTEQLKQTRHDMNKYLIER